MKYFLFNIIFFLVFYRIPFPYSSVYFSLFIGIFSIFILFRRQVRFILINSIGIGLLFSFCFMLLYSLAFDIIAGRLVSDLKNTFSLRLFMIIIMSVFPALLIVCYYIKGSEVKLKNIVGFAFLAQLLFWLFTFLVPGGKDKIYSLKNMSDNVNITILENYFVRGFGYAVEINYTAPFVMVLTAFTLFGISFLSFITLVTQIFNSNNVVIAFLLGLLTRLTKVNYIISITKIFIILSSIGYAIQSYIEYFPARLQEELGSGGTRTITYLIEDHLIFLNSGWFEFIFGTGNYIFQAGNLVDVDSGWIILINYGGILFTVIFLIFIFLLCLRAFDSYLIAVIWFVAGLWLNFKGLLLSPNAYFFMIFIFGFHRLLKFQNFKKFKLSLISVRP